MSSGDIVPSLKKYIRSSFPFQKGIENIGDDDALLETGIIDSMGILQFVDYLEAQYSIEIDDEEIVPDNFETIASVASLVNRKLGKNPA